MIKETDASTCDERRVKNKLNPLTHKRKGETRTMYNQSTKHWKLGAFFVISLVMIAGLFADIALGQLATITDNKATVYAGDIVDLELKYTAGEDIDVADTLSEAQRIGAQVNTIVFGLPITGTGWRAAFTDFSLTDEDVRGDVPANGVAIPLIDPTTFRRTNLIVMEPNEKSYVSWSSSLVRGLVVSSTTISGGNVTVTVRRIAGNNSAVMKKGNSVTVIYHNVKVGDAAPEEMIAVNDTPATFAADTTETQPSYKVTVVMLEGLDSDDKQGEGKVKLLSKEVTAESTVDLQIRYTATSDLAVKDKGTTVTPVTPADNGNSTFGRVQFKLPPDWGPAGQTTH